MPRGRPSLYEDRFCEMVVDFCEDGSSLTAFAASIDVCRETIQEWRRVHPEFSVACNRALAKAQNYWEKMMVSAARGEIIEKHSYGEGGCHFQKHNPIMIMFAMKARFEDYKEPKDRKADPEDADKDEFNLNYDKKKNQKKEDE